jgi:hypothetical protein
MRLLECSSANNSSQCYGPELTLQANSNHYGVCGRIAAQFAANKRGRFRAALHERGVVVVRKS